MDCQYFARVEIIRSNVEIYQEASKNTRQPSLPLFSSDLEKTTSAAQSRCEEGKESAGFDCPKLESVARDSKALQQYCAQIWNRKNQSDVWIVDSARIHMQRQCCGRAKLSSDARHARVSPSAGSGEYCVGPCANICFTDGSWWLVGSKFETTLWDQTPFRFRIRAQHSTLKVCHLFCAAVLLCLLVLFSGASDVSSSKWGGQRVAFRFRPPAVSSHPKYPLPHLCSLFQDENGSGKADIEGGLATVGAACGIEHCSR